MSPRRSGCARRGPDQRALDRPLSNMLPALGRRFHKYSAADALLGARMFTRRHFLTIAGAATIAAPSAARAFEVDRSTPFGGKLIDRRGDGCPLCGRHMLIVEQGDDMRLKELEVV